MKNIFSTLLFSIMLVLAGCARPDTTPTVPKAISKDQAVEIAFQKGRELNIPVDTRTPQVTVVDNCFVVEFPPPANMRAGSWMFKVDKNSGEIVHTKIER